MNYSTALIQLPLVRESTKEKIRTPADTFRVSEDIASLAQETFQVLSLNTKNMLISRHMATLGIVDASLVHPREVFRTAIENNATAVILIHNHPSGDPSPSADDIRVTKQLIEAGKVIDIKVLDHVIIVEKDEDHSGYLSLREEGLCRF